MLASSHFPIIGPGVVFIIIALPVLVMGLAAYFAAGDVSERDAAEPCPFCGDPMGEGACESPVCIYPWANYVPSEQDITDGYIRLLEEVAR